MASDLRIAVYSGSFDPLTLGHLNVIERAVKLVDRLVVGVGINTGKQPLFTIEERVDLLREATHELQRVEVRPFTGLAVNFVRECGARVMLRGVRSLTDIEAEFTMTLTNRKLDPDIETIWLTADNQYSHVSSSLIRQIAPLADDAQLGRFVPAIVVAALRKKMQSLRNGGLAPGT
jgi:pantetheine-phosphate adenylyltransferase